MTPEDYEVADRLGLTEKDENKPQAKAHKKKRNANSLRKAPQAPKRFKSSYICFFTAKQAEIKAELGGTPTVTEISRRSAEKWREISNEERAHYDGLASIDKQRYMVEKASYTGPWKVPWKRAKKDPGAPKRPMSAFLIFSQSKRREIKEEFPNITNMEVSKKLGELWRNASQEERAPHVAKEKVEREKYRTNMDKWKGEHEEKAEEERRTQAEQAQAQAQAAMYYNNPPQFAMSNQAAQYNYGVPTATGGYDLSMSQQLPAGQEQFYSYPPVAGFQGLYNYRVPSGPPAYYGREAVVLGPNGMPHYNPQFASSQEVQAPDQTPPFEEVDASSLQQVSYDFDQIVDKQE